MPSFASPVVWFASLVCAVGFLWAAPAELGMDWWNEAKVRHQVRVAEEFGERLDAELAAAQAIQATRRAAAEDLAADRLTPLAAARVVLGTGQVPAGSGATPLERAAHQVIESALYLLPEGDREAARLRWEELLLRELAAETG
jgi:hypothetical protein